MKKHKEKIEKEHLKTITYVLGVLGLGGIVFAVLAGIRWAVTYYDPSNALFGVAIGISAAFVAFGFAYLYEKYKKIEDRQRAHDLRWDSFIQDAKGKEELDNLKKGKK